MRIAALLCLLALAGAKEGFQSWGGTFRFSKIAWRRVVDNTVTFNLEVAFTRKVDTGYFKGSSLDGYARVGDSITITGQATPEFNFGDETLRRDLVIKVTAISEQEDWVMGELDITHTYATPNDNGNPWYASFTGCCRYFRLSNNADAPWELITTVDLTVAKESPRVNMLPVVTLASQSVDPTKTQPYFQIPAISPDGSDLSLKIIDGNDNGNAIKFDQSAVVSLPLNPFLTQDAMDCCDGKASSCPKYIKNNFGASPGCLGRLLRTDNVLPALTVEGWFYFTSVGGGVLFTANDTSCRQNCEGSLLTIAVDPYSVIVGHNVWDATKNALQFQNVTFRFASNPNVGTNSMQNMFVHIAVVRKTIVNCSSENCGDWYSTYKVYINGHLLGIRDYPRCISGQSCSIGLRNRNCQTTPATCSAELTIGESNPIVGPRRASALTGPGASCKTLSGSSMYCADSMGRNSSIIFGSASTIGAYGPFEGYLDEWRIWNGERSQSDIKAWYQIKLDPRTSDFNGDPTVILDMSMQPMQINKNNFDKMSLLLASYSFDARLATSSTGVTCRIPGCRFLSFKSTFPDIGKMDQSWIAAWTAPVSPQTGNVVMADIDNTGYVKQGSVAVLDPQGGCMCGCPFFVGSRCAIGSSYSILPGLYQVSIQVSSSLVNGPSTPVDFMLNVLASTYDSGHMRLLNKDTFWVNQYIPDSDIVGSFRTLQLGGVVEMVSPSLVDARSLQSFLYPQIVQTYANFEIKLTFVGSDVQKDINGNIDTKNTRVSFTLSHAPPEAQFSVVTGMNPAHMVMTWTPCESEYGLNIFCFNAVDQHMIGTVCSGGAHEYCNSDLTANCTSGTCSTYNQYDTSASSRMKCARVNVVQDPAPYFVSMVPSYKEFIAGKEDGLIVSGQDDNCLDSVRIEIEPSTPLPPGAMFGPQERVSLGVGKDCNGVQRVFKWKPDVKTGGYNRTTCFRIVDTGGDSLCRPQAPQSAVTCILIHVLRCKYALQQNQRLLDIASSFGISWMQLWSANLDLHHPDYILYRSQVLQLGHLYHVKGTETKDGLVARFGMNLQLLHELNYDLMSSSSLSAGSLVCVIPNSCTGMASTVYQGSTQNGNSLSFPSSWV
ncbi:hypothetical protein GUITHDRAFT_139145 [Guillardia theta CCMP2712]|uniref:Uncharacterized protein n=1 Tax=Guillardia theta (strain CCMP2712) TaxID=905079 RepID=L1JA83_GUITC|nr:hypothetical protein GUITHDRAFT_139145 [Guillardia theta CCMP2712]EKX45227.1 hypothetical protein GUITHDRAFT_139145 [Guillardia theta CCMP2712]|eukprot:XP_005832207.1 hypothetical protein GUITHDRAFT_139145 [Guillardia theta CCMP2712]